METVLDSSRDDTQFCTLLTRAVAERGLTLARIKAHLEAMGHTVSVATLSYWCTGRSLPTRVRSLDVVHALETVLRVPEGHLTAAIRPQPEQRALAETLELDPLVQEVSERCDLPPIGMWRPELVFHHAAIDRDSRQHCLTTRIGFRATTSGAQRWAVAVDRVDGLGVEARGDDLAPLLRQIVVNPDVTLLEFGLAEPVERDTLVMTEHEVHFAPGTTPVDSVGYSLTMPTKYFSLSVGFTDVAPRRLQRCHAAPEDTDTHPVEGALVTGPSGAQFVLPDAAPGHHAISWAW